MIGDPPLSGISHETFTSVPITINVGASIVEGTETACMLTVGESKLSPKMFSAEYE